MKKLLTIAMISLAALAAKADYYLYWTVPADAWNGAMYAELNGVGSGGLVSVGDWIDIGGAGDSYIGDFSAYYVKLYNEACLEVAISAEAISRDSFVGYMYQNGATAQRPADPISFSGFTGVIPEPTSGLMLLLGLAGLALKRKVA